MMHPPCLLLLSVIAFLLPQSCHAEHSTSAPNIVPPPVAALPVPDSKRCKSGDVINFRYNVSRPPTPGRDLRREPLQRTIAFQPTAHSVEDPHGFNHASRFCHQLNLSNAACSMVANTSLTLLVNTASCSVDNLSFEAVEFDYFDLGFPFAGVLFLPTNAITEESNMLKLVEQGLRNWGGYPQLEAHDAAKGYPVMHTEDFLATTIVDHICRSFAGTVRFCRSFRLPAWRLSTNGAGNSGYIDQPAWRESSLFQFTNTWHMMWSRIWRVHLAGLVGRPGIAALEIGSFEGQAAVWLLKEVRG